MKAIQSDFTWATIEADATDHPTPPTTIIDKQFNSTKQTNETKKNVYIDTDLCCTNSRQPNSMCHSKITAQSPKRNNDNKTIVIRVSEQRET